MFLYLVVLYLTLDVYQTELCGVFQILMVISLSLSVCLMWCGARAVGFLASLRVSDFQLRLDFLQLMPSDFQLTFGALLAHCSDSWQTFGRMHCTDTNKMLERRRFGILRAAISFQTWRKRSRPASVQSKTWVQGPNGLQRGQTMGQWVVARRQWAQNNSPNEVHLRSWPGSEQKPEFSICAAQSMPQEDRV